MLGEVTYDYAIIRVVPRVERGEQINVGVMLSVVDSDFLDARIEIDEARVRALEPDLDLDAVKLALANISVVCRGGERAGPIGALSARERFRWLTSPRSTVVQMSAVHTGRTRNPAACLDGLMNRMVRR